MPFGKVDGANHMLQCRQQRSSSHQLLFLTADSAYASVKKKLFMQAVHIVWIALLSSKRQSPKSKLNHFGQRASRGDSFFSKIIMTMMTVLGRR